MSGMERCALLKFGELALKGKNRWRFADRLCDNVRAAMAGLEPVELRRRGGVVAVFAPGHEDALVERARDVIGISIIHPAVVVARTPRAACETAIDLPRARPG